MEEQEFVPAETTYQQTESPFDALEPATVGQRFANYIIDLIVFYVVMFGFGVITVILSWLTGHSIDSGDETLTGNGFLDYFVAYGFYAIYYTFSEGASRGRSIGKLITRTKVVREDGSEISWGDALKRSVCRAIPFEQFTAFGGYPLHDRIPHTKVIKVTKKPVRTF